MTFFLFGLYFTQRFCNLFGSGTLSQKSLQGVVCPHPRRPGAAVCCMGGVRFLVSMMLRLRATSPRTQSSPSVAFRLFPLHQTLMRPRATSRPAAASAWIRCTDGRAAGGSRNSTRNFLHLSFHFPLTERVEHAASSRLVPFSRRRAPLSL